MSESEDLDLFDDSSVEAPLREFKTTILPLNTIEGRRQRYIRSKSFQYDTMTVLTPEECLNILKELTFDAKSRHTSFRTRDTSVHNHPLSSLILKYIERVLRNLEEKTGFDSHDLELLDCFFVEYNEEQPALAPHTDGCLLSFNIQLNCTTEFEGGGTRFTDLQKTVKLKQGECLLHSAKLLHEGVEVTGRRVILVGFVETRRRGGLSKQALFNQDLAMRNIR